MFKRIRLSGLPSYRSIWRFHFYAGIFCIPFILILSITGTLYLFEEQIESWIESPYHSLAVSTPQNPENVVRAAKESIPNSTLRYYQLPASNESAIRVMLLAKGERQRTYIHPSNLEVLQSFREEDRFMRITRRLHGQLLLGENGSYLVELVACWTIILVLSGLYLWWPRNAKSFAGIVYPRLNSDGKTFWRDLHSVTGFWISSLVIVLILTGLPWTKFWGGNFRKLRKATHTSTENPGWSTRSAFRDKPPASDYDLHELNRVVQTAHDLQLHSPVQISPPVCDSVWTVQSMTQNRPKRADVAVDGKTGEVLHQHRFQDKHLIDQVIGTGIAYHEGQLFGWPNQLLGVITTAGLVLLSLSGTVLWWRRRQPNSKFAGAPKEDKNNVYSFSLLAFVALLGILLPLFGISLVAAILLDRLLLSRFSKT